MAKSGAVYPQARAAPHFAPLNAGYKSKRMG